MGSDRGGGRADRSEPRLEALRRETGHAQDEARALVRQLIQIRQEIQTLADDGRLHAEASWRALQRVAPSS